MSWIIRDLWRSLEERRIDYEDALRHGKLQAFETVNGIASKVGARWGVFIQLNFPPGRIIPSPEDLGHRDLSILVYRERKKFEGVTEDGLRERLQVLKPISFDNAGFGYEGLRVKLRSGRIDCLPGGVHVWCELSRDVLEFLDWLFENAYGLKEP